MLQPLSWPFSAKSCSAAMLASVMPLNTLHPLRILERLHLCFLFLRHSSPLLLVLQDLIQKQISQGRLSEPPYVPLHYQVHLL